MPQRLQGAAATMPCLHIWAAGGGWNGTGSLLCGPWHDGIDRPMLQLAGWWCSTVLRQSFNHLMRLAVLQGEELIVNEDEPAVPAHVQHAKPPPAETPEAPGEHGLTSPAVATDSQASFVQCSTAYVNCCCGVPLADCNVPQAAGAVCHAARVHGAQLHSPAAASPAGQSCAIRLPALPP